MYIIYSVCLLVLIALNRAAQYMIISKPRAVRVKALIYDLTDVEIGQRNEKL